MILYIKTVFTFRKQSVWKSPLLFAAEAREQSITNNERNELIQKFRDDIQKGYNVWTVTTETYDAAAELCRLHPLRAYDAVQLACALAIRALDREYKAHGLIFLCADNNLLNIASKEGLDVKNPNQL